MLTGCWLIAVFFFVCKLGISRDVFCLFVSVASLNSVNSRRLLHQDGAKH